MAFIRVSKNLSKERAKAVSAINLRCGEKRSEFATDIPFQGEVYAEKEAEARRFLDSGGDLSAYPFLSAEIGITAQTASDLAVIWINGADNFRRVAAAIEAIRIGAVTAVEAATTARQIDAAVSAAHERLNGI